MKSKWHNISIRSESFAELLELQKRLPIRASIPQLIEWLIKVGQKNGKRNQILARQHQNSSSLTRKGGSMAPVFHGLRPQTDFGAVCLGGSRCVTAV